MNVSTSDIKDPGFSLNCRGKLLDLSTPIIMGILNLTPDSFSDGGKHFEEKSALDQVAKMLKEGATIIDIGAQSTRPKAEFLQPETEISRLGKLIPMIKKEFPEVTLSLDTFYSEVVQFGFDEGIDIINDISGGNFDPKMFETVAKTGLPYILMHVNETYDLMHKKLIEEDLLLKMNRYFSEKINELQSLGVKDIILDPGFGFGKTVEQQHQLLNETEFIDFGKHPLLIGISRKSFIYKPLGKKHSEIVEETQKFHQQVLEKGAKILRVHDVAEASKTVDIFLNR
ncbi:dihydropteroate synthase [Kaistella jeonii]|uniref:dihydropteroate synthase n=1 Tax=Kaistella jeonii TaxID=266749 RepID=UPI00068F46E8|nr:dihydropteroate synthase [Kaistella jeonii]SFC09216.1 dihydropteroate synthase [Kaistella jeonii]VEI95211.1 Dihydropteroate synthase [Kaistella jeonii]